MRVRVDHLTPRAAPGQSDPVGLVRDRGEVHHAGQRLAEVAVAQERVGVSGRVKIGLPRGGTWREVINTDAHVYGGSGVGNLGTVEASDRAPAHGQPASAVLRVPPLGALWLRPA